jgi:hypothetical protein
MGQDGAELYDNCLLKRRLFMGQDGAKLNDDCLLKC